MDIRKENQYNQSMGKYKILSTAAGVGSIITTKWGGFIMPLSINNWKFVEVVSNKIKEIQSQTLNIPKIQEECGVELIEDPRFVDFLNVKKGFPQLNVLLQYLIFNYNVKVIHFMNLLKRDLELN